MTILQMLETLEEIYSRKNNNTHWEKFENCTQNGLCFCIRQTFDDDPIGDELVELLKSNLPITHKYDVSGYFFHPGEIEPRLELIRKTIKNYIS